jgi:predicted Rossmann fold flavoprotein
MSKYKAYDVVIIGAGAAGLMCAIEAGNRGRSTLVLDHANKPGKKILMSGGGRCNFTNLHTKPENYLSHNRHFCRSALSRYTPQDFIALVQKHQIAYHEKTLGQLFCNDKAKDIVNMLLTECEAAKAKVQLETSTANIEQGEAGFLLNTSHGDYRCESLVIASGGLSIPTLGASPFGYKIAKQFGIDVWPTRAGLVPFTLHEKDKTRYAPLSGVAVDCAVTCEQQSFREAMLFTHRGLSGPAMLQISSYWQPGGTLSIDLVPQVDLLSELMTAKQNNPKLHLKNKLCEYLPNRVVDVFISDNLPLQHYSHSALNDVANLVTTWQIKPNNTEGYRTAEVTLGGVDCDAISSKTFESRDVPGLYFIGEVLDVAGWLGGYNFQWAWASGFAAGQFV